MTVKFDQLLQHAQEVVEASLKDREIDPFDAIAYEIETITDPLLEDDIVSLLTERPSLLRKDVFLQDGGFYPLRDIVANAINVELQKNLDFGPLLDRLGGWDVPQHLIEPYEQAFRASNALTR